MRIPRTADARESHVGPVAGLAVSPPAKRVKKNNEVSRSELTYSLFPPPIDRARLLGMPKPRSSPISKTTMRSDELPKVVASSSSKIEAPREAPQRRTGKRKRSPSPDVIPNPPGCSYGMDLDFFTYDEEDEVGAGPAPPAKTAEATAAALPKQAFQFTPTTSNGRLISSNAHSVPPSGGSGLSLFKSPAGKPAPATRSNIQSAPKSVGPNPSASVRNKEEERKP